MIVLYIFLGTFLTPSEIILVTVPVLLPGAQTLVIHPIHFGMVCVVAVLFLVAFVPETVLFVPRLLGFVK